MTAQHIKEQAAVMGPGSESAAEMFRKSPWWTLARWSQAAHLHLRVSREQKPRGCQALGVAPRGLNKYESWRLCDRRVTREPCLC